MRLLEEVNTTKGNAGGCGEAGQVLSLAVLFCLAKISVYAYKKNCKGKGYCKGMGIRVRSETYKIGGGFRVQYDFGDEVADRYTIVYVNKNIKDGYGVVYYPVFSCSEDPFHPLGVGMYAGDYYPHRSHMYNFGKRVKDIDSLPKKVIEFIKYITR